jgi:hypothetical protein
VKLINEEGNTKWFGINGGFYFPKGTKSLPKERYVGFVGIVDLQADRDTNGHENDFANDV